MGDFQISKCLRGSKTKVFAFPKDILSIGQKTTAEGGGGCWRTALPPPCILGLSNLLAKKQNQS